MSEPDTDDPEIVQSLFEWLVDKTIVVLVVLAAMSVLLMIIVFCFRAIFRS